MFRSLSEKNLDRRRTVRQPERSGRAIFSYPKGHDDTSRKYESSQSPDELDYNSSLGYAREVKKNVFGHLDKTFLTLEQSFLYTFEEYLCNKN